MKAEWLDRALVECPYFYTLCTTDKAFREVLKRLDLPKADWPPFLKTERANATLHAFESDEKLVAVLCVPVNKKVERNQIAALLAHEAQHLWRWAREALGEACPSSEFEAYAVQRILQSFLYEYDRQTAKAKR